MVPHQANLRIINAACQRLGIPEEKAVVVIDRYGNTSSASIPLALADALDTGRLQAGHHVLLTGFGGGMTWASAVLALGRVSSTAWHHRPRRCWPPAWPAATAAASRWPRSDPTVRRCIDLLVSDAVAAGFGQIVLVLHPETGPAIRYHVEQCWPEPVDVAFAEQRLPLGHGARRAGRPGGPRTRPVLRRGQCRRRLRRGGHGAAGSAAGDRRRPNTSWSATSSGPPWPPMIRSPGASATWTTMATSSALTERRQVHPERPEPVR